MRDVIQIVAAVSYLLGCSVAQIREGPPQARAAPSRSAAATAPHQPGTATTRRAPEAAQRVENLINELEREQQLRGQLLVERNRARAATAVRLYSRFATNENVRLLRGLAELTKVQIACSREGISADTVDNLANLPHLRQIELSFAVKNFTIAHGAAMARMKNLESVSINSCTVEPDALTPLRSLPTLKDLGIRYQGFSDAEAAQLAGMEQVESLDLSYTDVTDSALKILAKLPKLKHLVVEHTKITENGVLACGLNRRVVVEGASREQ